MNCHDCHQETEPDHLFLCYWCGQPVCDQCLTFVPLPQDTTVAVCGSCRQRQTQSAADESMWQVAVEASLGGHDLEAWVVMEDGLGWQTRCRLCDLTAWVGHAGVMYVLLADTCPRMKQP